MDHNNTTKEITVELIKSCMDKGMSDDEIIAIGAKVSRKETTDRFGYEGALKMATEAVKSCNTSAEIFSAVEKTLCLC